jgi:hypothetical protein
VKRGYAVGKVAAVKVDPYVARNERGLRAIFLITQRLRGMKPILE